MALYLHDQIGSGLFTDSMKQETEKQAHSPSLNNNNTSIFPNMLTPPGTSPLSMPLPHQLYMGLMAGLPLLTNPSLFQQQQNILSNWPLPVVSSPSPTSLHSADPVSPVMNMKYTSQKHSSNNNNSSTNNNNNNNVVSSSADRVTKRGQVLKRKPSMDQIQKSNLTSSPASTEANSPQSPPSLATHEGQKDTRDRNFQCKVCNRSFGYKHVLQNHERTHTGEKPFECPECHKRFTRDHHLKTHLRLHTGEKPYNCDHCHRKFVQVANLRRHLRVHTGERPYICEVCQAKFSDSNQLKAHKLIHDDEKPHKCRRCDLRFCRKSQLNSHKCSRKISNNAGSKSPSLSTSGDLKVEVDFEMNSPVDKNNTLRHGLLRTLSSPTMMSPNVTIPLNLSGSLSRTVVSDIPEQTEPEDLSMSTGMRPYSRSHSNGDSPLSRSPSIDTVKDEDEDELDMSQASPSSLFLQHQVNAVTVKMEPEPIGHQS